jgi:TolA-binding protein
MNDRLIDLERKMQAMNGEISSLKSENSLLKSTIAANSNSANFNISSLESDNDLLKSTMAADADCKLHD